MAESMPLPEPVAQQTRRAASPRDERLEAMVQTYFDVVWRSLRRLGVADGSLDDAAQQVFMIAARKLETIDPAGEKPYLLGIAVRVASDSRRSWTRRREVSDQDAAERVDPAPSPEELVDRKRAREWLDRVLAAMPMDLRVPFTMFEIEGLSVPEVATALGVPVGTAASRLRRAREEFREHVRRIEARQGGPRV
jgi:RNA polymerase sigma-70 factor (ECF subfamily)